MDFLKDLIGENSQALMATLTSKAGFSADQARAFVPEATGSVADALKDTKDIDLSNVASAANTLTERVDVASLAGKVGIDTAQAKNGLSAMLPQLLELFKSKAGGAAGVMSMLGGLKEGGLGGTLGNLGKMFGK